MSTSLLYAFGLKKGIEYHLTRYIGNYAIFSAEMNSRKFTCPKCRSDQIIYKGNKSGGSTCRPLVENTVFWVFR